MMGRMANDGGYAAPSAPRMPGPIAGRYRITGRLGRGGMGTVWRATDELLDRQVAVKELHLNEGLSESDEQLYRDRALREARSVAQIRHPHVVVLHDVVEQDGRPWIVMELIDGRSLADVLAQDGPVDPREAARIGAAVAGALHAAHERGVLHRDIKPGERTDRAGHRADRAHRLRDRAGVGYHDADRDRGVRRLARVHVAGADVRGDGGTGVGSVVGGCAAVRVRRRPLAVPSRFDRRRAARRRLRRHPPARQRRPAAAGGLGAAGARHRAPDGRGRGGTVAAHVRRDR